VSCLGVLPRPEVYRVASQARALLYPSFSEAFSLVQLHAGPRDAGRRLSHVWIDQRLWWLPDAGWCGPATSRAFQGSAGPQRRSRGRPEDPGLPAGALGQDCRRELAELPHRGRCVLQGQPRRNWPQTARGIWGTETPMYEGSQSLFVQMRAKVQKLSCWRYLSSTAIKVY